MQSVGKTGQRGCNHHREKGLTIPGKACLAAKHERKHLKSPLIEKKEHLYCGCEKESRGRNYTSKKVTNVGEGGSDGEEKEPYLIGSPAW